MAEILDTTDVSQWKHVSGINNPADTGTRAINIEELKRSEWLTGPAWLKRPESEWPEQVNLIFASDEENIPSSVFMIQAEEKKAVIQWERFGHFYRLVNTMAYVQRALSKYKPAKLVVSVEEREKAKATIFKLLHQEHFGEEMKSLKAEKEIPKSSKILQFSPFLYEEGLFRAKGRIGKCQLDFNAKHPILLHWKHHAVELFLRNEHKGHLRHLACKKHCSAKDVDPRHRERLNINHEQVRYLQKMQSTNDSTSNGRSTRRAVKFFNNLYKCWSSLLWYFHSEDWAKERKAMVLSVYLSNYESGAYRSGTQVGDR